MIIDRNVWDKVGSIVEATFVNIVEKKKVPQDFDLDELKSICYLECGYLLGRYKGAQALTTYVYENLEKRVIIRMKVERFYDDYEFLTLYFDRKIKYYYETSIEIADDNGLGDIARCIGKGLTLREMAVKLGCSLATVLKKMAKLRECFDLNKI